MIIKAKETFKISCCWRLHPRRIVYRYPAGTIQFPGTQTIYTKDRLNRLSGLNMKR